MPCRLFETLVPDSLSELSQIESGQTRAKQGVWIGSLQAARAWKTLVTRSKVALTKCKYPNLRVNAEEYLLK